MTLEELEEALSDILPNGFSIEADSHGQIIVYTNLTEDEDGELIDFEGEDDEDPDFDGDLEALKDDDDDE